MIFETHAHYDDEKFDTDRVGLLSGMKANGIGAVINVGASFEGAKASVRLSEEWPGVYAAIGIHPSEIGDFDTADVTGWLRAHASAPKVVAIGEIGLDYYWDKEPAVQEAQRRYFREQLSVAKDCGLPVIIHSREAAADTLSIMREAAAEGIPGVIHCYSYSAEQAVEYVKMGYYIGVGGVLTFKNGRRLREAVEAVPLSHILLETDSPYLAPEPHRGERNESKWLHLIAEKLAEIKGVSVAEIEDVTWDNACRLFSVS